MLEALCDAARACQGILLALDQDPSNLDLRLILADAYEDAGEVEVATFWRWVHREKRSPHFGIVKADPDAETKTPSYYWTHDSNRYYQHKDKKEYPLLARLPHSVFTKLPPAKQQPWKGWHHSDNVWQYYPSWLAAMEASLVAWQSLPCGERPC